MAEYIEREAIKQSIKNSDMWNREKMSALMIVSAEPAADVAPVVHSHWVHDINNLYGCYRCMERETMSQKKLKPYCPNCGAHMKDGE